MTFKNLQEKFSRRIHRKKTFNQSDPKISTLKFDKDGRFLLVSHVSAGFYYKLNFGFLLIWFLISYKYVIYSIALIISQYRSYKENPTFLFSNKYVTKAYMGLIILLFFVSFSMSNRHLKYLYLHSNGTHCTLVMHKWCSLWYSEQLVDIKSFTGVSHLLYTSIHLYQLRYKCKGWIKERDNYFIFRPQNVTDPEIWRLVRTGNYVRTPEYMENNKNRFEF